MSTIIEIRPDHGGKDAEDFAAELATSIASALAKSKHICEAEPMSEVNRSYLITTNAPASELEWLQGSHVVTRIPKKSAARHTSEATVVVRSDAARGRKQDDSEIPSKDIRIDRYRGHGAGGQKRNKTESAIRLVHIPSGIVITRISGRSQTANIADAMQELKGRLEEQKQALKSRNVAKAREKGLNSGGRAFTHNYQRDEVVAHNAGKRWRLKEWNSGRWNILN